VKINLNKSRALREGGFAGISAAAIAATAAVVGAGTAVAGAAGAFGKPGGGVDNNKLIDAYNKDESKISDLQKQIDSQNQAISDTQTKLDSKAKSLVTWEIIAAVLGLVSAVAFLISLRKRKKI
jgi:hypothetical protein